MKPTTKYLRHLKNICLIVLSTQLLLACTNLKHETSFPAESQVFSTHVISEKDAIREDADWGVFRKYFEGSTVGTKNVLSGTAEIKPGMEIHPPHTHEEEEYLMIMEGEGSWTINGETFPAKAGDILYAKPWDSHGIENTGDTTLKFVFWKWTSSAN